MMANALAPMMPRAELPGMDPNMPMQRQPVASMSLPTAVAPAPVAAPAAPTANALKPMTSSPYMAPAKKPQNTMLGLAIDGFQRGFDPKGRQADIDQRKADGMEKAKQTLALMQQQRALPAEQRAQWWTQNAPQIGQIIGQDLSQQQVDPNAFTDEAMDGQIAALAGSLGIAPSAPEPMSAYQKAQIDLEREKLKQPKAPIEVNGVLVDPVTYKPVYTSPEKPKEAEPFTLSKDQVRYGPDGKVIARGPSGGAGEGGGGMDPERIRLEREYAKSWDGVRNNFGEVDGQYKRLVALGELAKKDPASRSAADLGLIVSFTKMLDPGSVAREGEVKLTQSAASLVDMVANLPNQWKNGQTTLPDSTRDALLKAAAEMHPIYERAFEKLGRSYLKTAQSYQYDPSRVMMGTDLSTFDNMSDDEIQSIFDGIEQAAASPTGSGAVPPDAAAELMRDPSPEAMAEFDDAFGPGMAQRVLNGSR